jgi:hypothetical protein
MAVNETSGDECNMAAGSETAGNVCSEVGRCMLYVAVEVVACIR